MLFVILIFQSLWLWEHLKRPWQRSVVNKFSKAPWLGLLKEFFCGHQSHTKHTINLPFCIKRYLFILIINVLFASPLNGFHDIPVGRRTLSKLVISAIDSFLLLLFRLVFIFFFGFTHHFTRTQLKGDVETYTKDAVSLARPISERNYSLVTIRFAT